MSSKCQVNKVPQSEDHKWPFDGVVYEPCGEMAVWCLEEDDGDETWMCEEHALEAGR